MSDGTQNAPSKGVVLRTEIENLKLALQTAAGGVDEQVQAILTRMEQILQPAA